MGNWPVLCDVDTGRGIMYCTESVHLNNTSNQEVFGGVRHKGFISFRNPKSIQQNPLISILRSLVGCVRVGGRSPPSYA